MDEFVTKYYRRLLRTGFEYAGEMENHDIFLDSVGERIRICGHNTNNFMHIFIKLSEWKIDDIKYLCTCDPTANVAIEIFCKLVKGKTLKEAAAITPDSFSRDLGSTEEEFLKRAEGIIELFHKGLQQYYDKQANPG